MPLSPPKSSATPFPPPWFVLLLPALAAAVLYAPTLAAGFLSDDYSQLHAFDGCDGADGLGACVVHLFVSGMSAPSFQYRPLGMASFALNVMLSADPYYWHLVNVALHAANAALVALLATQLMIERTIHTRYAALAAGWMFAWFAPGVEAVAWVAARFDGLALFFMLTAGCAFIASRRWNDGFALVSLVATILAFLSKEAAAIGIVLIVALAWWKQPSGAGFARNALRAPIVAAPWLLIAAVYFVGRALLFGDAFRVYAGVSPLRALVTGEWLVTLPGIVAWSRSALPETAARIAFAFSALVLASCAIVAGMRERNAARALCVVVVTVTISLALVLAQLHWAPNGEGGRVLYAIGAIALPGLTLPLAAAGPRLRFVAWACVSVLLGSEYALAHAAIGRWVHAGADARALATALADTAAATPAEGYAFVVIPDHVGAIPFGRNAQGGLILPPVQTRSLSPKLIVQTPDALAQWPDLFERDIIGRLRRESLGSVVANLRPPAVPPPHALPDRYFCWSPRAGALVRLPVIDEAGLANWDATWARALDSAGCE
ncbi:MAG TPA: hypothetical protein VF959_07600 [Casimicrobiaceae bacterium]